MLHMAGVQIFSLLMDEGKQKKQQIEFRCEICLKNLVSIKLHEFHSAHAGCRYNVIRSLSFLYGRRNVLFESITFL